MFSFSLLPIRNVLDESILYYSQKIPFFPFTIIEWSELDRNTHSPPPCKRFRKRIIEFIRPHCNSTFTVPNALGLTYLTKLRHGFSGLRDHKFCLYFWNSLNPFRNCGNATELTKRYLLPYSNLKNERHSPLQNVRIDNANPNCLSMNESALTHLLQYSDNTLTDNAENFLLNSVIEDIK